MAAPNNWEDFRVLFAELAHEAGARVPQRFGGEAEELYCFPTIGKRTIAEDLGEAKFITIMETIWADNTAARGRVVASARSYFARLAASDKLTQEQAKAEWKAKVSRPGRKKENAEDAVVYGLAMMLVDE